MLDLTTTIHQCSPQVSPVTMQAIIRTESGGNPNAIGLNKGFKLKYPASSKNQATAWVNYLEKHQYNFDVGIAQVNIKNIHKYGYKAADALDPCINLKMAGDILLKNYQSAKSQSQNSSEALSKAISAYNTGNFSSGFNNGYVKKVYAAAGNSSDSIPPLTHTKNVKSKKMVKVMNRQEANDEITPYNSKSVLYVKPKTS